MIMACLVMVSCGGDSNQGESRLAPGQLVADSHLPGSLPGIALQKMAVKKTDAGLEDYVGALADHYYEYDLVGLAAATYETDFGTISTEIAQFVSPLNAYGYYSSLRPDGVDLSSLGTESFAAGNSFYFAQGLFVVTVSGMGDTPEVSDMVQRLAVTISASIGDAPPVPVQFAQFPMENRVAASNRYFAVNFLNADRLDSVFTMKYDLGGDTVMVFLSHDRLGAKFLSLGELATDLNATPDSVSSVGFDEDLGIAIAHPLYGVIVAGLCEGQLLGAGGKQRDKLESVLRDLVISYRE